MMSDRVRVIFYFLIPVIILPLLALYFYKNNVFDWTHWPWHSSGSDLIACYEINTNNNLPSIQSENVPKNTSFFFIETSCHDTYLRLNARQVCSIESAALLNPSSNVYLLIPSPIREPERFDQHTKILLSSYKNIKFRHINMTDFFKSTPLEEWYVEDKLKSSRWPVHHASDVLRFLILWKYGGIYADLDVVYLKPFQGLSNFAGVESYGDNIVASCIISLTHGHPLSDITIRETRDGFDGSRWGHNGPGVITTSLQQYCAVSKVSEMTKDKCHGFTVFTPEKLTPIHWKQVDDLFSIEKADSVLAQFNESLAVHFWNYLSSKNPVIVGSGQPYDRLAAKFCPRVYSTLGGRGSIF